MGLLFTIPVAQAVNPCGYWTATLAGFPEYPDGFINGYGCLPNKDYPLAYIATAETPYFDGGASVNPEGAPDLWLGITATYNLDGSWTFTVDVGGPVDLDLTPGTITMNFSDGC